MILNFSRARSSWPSSNKGNSPTKPPAISWATTRALPRSLPCLRESSPITLNSRTSSRFKPGNMNLWFQVGFKLSWVVRVWNFKSGWPTTSQTQYAERYESVLHKASTPSMTTQRGVSDKFLLRRCFNSAWSAPSTAASDDVLCVSAVLSSATHPHKVEHVEHLGIVELACPWFEAVSTLKSSTCSGCCCEGGSMDCKRRISCFSSSTSR
mmetsp:Transcript_140711/g.350817  ORF Transcript_140711/g.350817 Transcript_140711/m.350817 type:complete len:210 (-) Transcript_140711:349-978(-)